jgi:hypothetical protein
VGISGSAGPSILRARLAVVVSAGRDTSADGHGDAGLVRLFLGVAEVLAAIGLTLPGITRVQPGLISWAAAGLMIVMVGATVLHSTRGETSAAMLTALLFALLTSVAYLRWKVRPIAPRVDRSARLSPVLSSEAVC